MKKIKTRIAEIVAKRTTLEARSNELFELFLAETHDYRKEAENCRYLIEERDVISRKALNSLGLLNNSIRGLKKNASEINKILNDGIELTSKIPVSENAMLTITYKDKTKKSFPCILEKMREITYVSSAPELDSSNQALTAVIVTTRGDSRAVCIKCLKMLALFSDPEVLCTACYEGTEHDEKSES